jgi:ATP-dependent Lon protease
MDLPREIAVMTLPNAILFPQAMLRLHIFEPRYRQMLRDALNSHRMFSVAMQKPGRVREIPSNVAGLGLIRISLSNKDGTSHLILQGLTRVQLAETVQYKPYRIQKIRPIETEGEDSVAVDALIAKVLELVAERLDYGFEFPVHVLKQFGELIDAGAGETGVNSLKHLVKYLVTINNPDQLADLVSCTLLTGSVERQTILETAHLETRLKYLIHFLMAENNRCKKK